MKYVTVNDPITRVYAGYTVCETVELVTRDGFATSSCAPSDDGGIVRHEDEGSTWVRGWYLPDSEEVQAARTAQALSDTKKEEIGATGSIGVQGFTGPPGPMGPMGRGGIPQPMSPQPAGPHLYGSIYPYDGVVVPTTTDVDIAPSPSLPWITKRNC